MACPGDWRFRPHSRTSREGDHRVARKGRTARKRSFSEKLMIVVGILVAVSMVIALFGYVLF